MLCLLVVFSVVLDELSIRRRFAIDCRYPFCESPTFSLYPLLCLLSGCSRTPLYLNVVSFRLVQFLLAFARIRLPVRSPFILASLLFAYRERGVLCVCAEVTLNVAEMQTLLANHLAVLKGQDDLQRCASYFPAACAASSTVAVAFWYSVDDVPVLPDVSVDGLMTAVSVAKYTVHLYTYRKLQNVPEAVVMKDARECMPEEQFQEQLRSGHAHVAVLADYIRLRGMSASMADFVVFIDTDTHWVRDMRDFKPPEGFAATVTRNHGG